MYGFLATTGAGFPQLPAAVVAFGATSQLEACLASGLILCLGIIWIVGHADPADAKFVIALNEFDHIGLDQLAARVFRPIGWSDLSQRPKRSEQSSYSIDCDCARSGFPTCSQVIRDALPNAIRLENARKKLSDGELMRVHNTSCQFEYFSTNAV
jgi:hypothetical protein